jgi:hypothetical protein
MKQHFCILEIAFQDVLSFSFEHVMYITSPQFLYRFCLFEKMIFVAIGGRSPPRLYTTVCLPPPCYIDYIVISAKMH